MEKLVWVALAIFVLFLGLILPGSYIAHTFGHCPQYGSCSDAIVRDATAFWIVISVCAIGSYFAISEHNKRAKENRARMQRLQAEQAERERDLLRRKNQQESLKTEIQRTKSAALQSYFSIPNLLVQAENSLVSASQNFDEGAFSPFWEDIELVLNKLAQVEENVACISYLATSYAGLVKDFEGQAEPFPIAASQVSRLGAAQKTQMLMRSLIRRAQKNFQFSTIFEQRRTTHVLIRGFATLGQAIEGLGDRVVGSIDSLRAQVGELQHGLYERHAEMMFSLDATVTEIHSASMAAVAQRASIADAQANAAEEQLAMLDNIQRRREPLESERGPRRF